MTRRTSGDAFADVARAMAGSAEVGDILADLLADCAASLHASAVAILVSDGRGRLSLLASSSADVAQLEMLQAQDEQGPCVDAIRSGATVSAAGAQELVRRWGPIGKAITGAGYASVDAVPMTWRGQVVGGLNVFRSAPREPDAETDALAEAFANVATIVVLHSVDLPADQIASRIYEAVMARSTIEQAKGVLAQVEDLDMEAAAGRLRDIALAEGSTLTQAALAVVRQAH
jgi:GAF domain-containing protein